MGGIVSFTLPFTTHEMMSISTSQSFRSWVAVVHLLQPMSFSSLGLYDMHEPASHMNVLFWRTGDFPVNIQTGIPRGTLEIVTREVLWFKQYEISHSRMLHDILTLCHRHQFYHLHTELALRWITDGVHAAFQRGGLTILICSLFPVSHRSTNPIWMKPSMTLIIKLSLTDVNN